ncbi:uncharacterized protein LOC128273327 [Anopheles cruzii]|uniref:uncharacterized protein LOC128273327 n=1 Tax=Anopheles cruzii TaxID=68878 RepID=UPI0022EC27E9|nr:uncharacterized protein LOC128273327 [Anopheles cruzii]
MRNYGSCFLLLLAVVSTSSALVYQCEPGTGPTLCRITNFVYSEGLQPLPVVNLSNSVNSIQVYYQRNYSKRKAEFSVYDATLHETVFRRPTSVMIFNCYLQSVVIPPNLQVGDFFSNNINTIETDRKMTYDLRYLDVSHNSLSELKNLSVLVQLQTLNLEENQIATLVPETFASMRNLSVLYVGSNSIVQIDLKMLPKSLTFLSIFRNELTELEFAGVSMRVLRMLDIESNNLVSLDVKAMLAAAPSLELVTIEFNLFSKAEAERIIAELRGHNVTYYTPAGDPEPNSINYCDAGEYEVERVCFDESLLASRSFTKAIVLLLIAVVVVGVFVLSVRWVWHQMRY